MSRRGKILVFGLLALVALLASIPLWLGLALRPILRARNITFESYERVGYAHFRLHHARYEKPGRVIVSIETIEAPTPLLWLAQRFGTQPRITAENWSLTILHDSAALTPAAPKSDTSMPWLLPLLRRVDRQLVRWLPRAHLHHGLVHGTGPDWSVAELDWENHALALQGVLTVHGAYDVTVTPSATGPFIVAGHSVGNDLQVHVDWTGGEFKGTASVWDQPVQASVTFPTHGWLPTAASAIAENWSLPAARVKLAAPYARVRGDARLVWHDGAFAVTATASAQPVDGAKAPPFSAHAIAHGGFRELSLTALDVDAPFATARLTAPVTISLDHPLAAASARLTVQADLARLPWGGGRVHGTMTGTVNVTGDPTNARQTFALDFKGVKLPGLTLQAAHAAGSLHWPQLELTTLRVQLDKTSSVEAQGTVDWQKRELSHAALRAKLSPAALARWLPRGLTWDSAEITATADGPLAAPHHHGSLHLVGARWGAIHPLLVDTSWQGTGAKADTLSARATAGHSALELDGKLDAHGLHLDKLQLTVGDQKVWRLATLAHLTWSPEWRLDQLQLTGPASQLRLKVAGGPHGSFELSAGRFDSAWLRDWVNLAGPAWQLHSLAATGHVAEGVLLFDASLAAQINTVAQPAEVKFAAQGDAAGVQLKELTVMEADRVLTKARGRLPISWRFQPDFHLQLDDTAPLELDASTDPASPLWSTLSAATSLTLAHPTARISLKGTLRAPVGELQVRVRQLSVAGKKGNFSLPEATDLALEVQFGRDRVTLTHFSARLDGQAVSASGQIPMSDHAWRQLWQNPAAFDWREAEGQLSIPAADLAAFAQRAPDFIAALGRLQVQVALARGGKFTGRLRLINAATRPLPPFGTLQQINADVEFAGRTLTVKSLTAKLGGEPVTVDGRVTLVPGGPPHLALSLQGTHLPLARNPGLLVRSDLDLRATTDAAGLTRLTGRVTVRDSLVLADFNSLLPTGPRGVTRPPPYFAVQAEPFRNWPLDIDVRGPQAVRVRTTVFSGVVSVRFHLGGTLGEPRAVGDLAVDQGLVLFPFATFKVQQGTLRLSEADPFHARVSLIGTSQRQDYQLRLEVTGQLPDPVVIMSSTPALDATSVLLMVMTGRPPASDTAAVTSSTQRLALFGAYLGRGVFDELGFSGEDRLEVSSGERISQQGQETYEIEYKLGDKWSLVGEYDELDSYNAGLKWRVYTQESVPREKK